MKHYKTLWLLLMMMVGGLAMTSCSDKDDQESSGGGGEEVKDYVERMYPVVDPKENSHEPFSGDDISWNDHSGAESWQWQVCADQSVRYG